MKRDHGLPSLVLLILAWLAPNVAQAQWDPSARLGLSAAPDRHVGYAEATIDEPFDLYVILTGMTDDEPLTFALQAVEWIVNTACCGDSPVGVVQLVHGPGVAGDGDPYEAIISLAEDCLAGSTILLATVTFDWLMEGESEFVLSAAALTGALDCEDDAHLLQTIAVLVQGQEPTPAQTSSWTGVRSLFNDRKE
jgi:hypothetical protein